MEKSSDSDCMITDVVEGGERFLTLDDGDDQLLKKDGLKVEKMSGDGHCISHCFARHFQEPFATVINRLENEFQNNLNMKAFPN